MRGIAGLCCAKDVSDAVSAPAPSASTKLRRGIIRFVRRSDILASQPIFCNRVLRPCA
jgi:hypothetical protein